MTLRTALAPGGSLSALAAHRRFIIFRLDWMEDKGKYNKVPCDWQTAATANAHDVAIQTDWQTACDAAERLGNQYGVGYVFTPAEGFFCLDIDSCLVDGRWSDLSQQLIAALPGAAVEVSVSGTGLHVFGRGVIPPHSIKNTVLKMELYHEERFIALTGTNVVGSADTDCSQGLLWLVPNYFPKAVHAEFVWTDLGVPESEDARLLDKMTSTKSASSQFGGKKATFKALWEADAKVLGRAYPGDAARPYDGSSADMALFQHLAFWTKKDCARMWRMGWKSALVRDKWRERPEYVRDTILNACARCTEVLADRNSVPSLGATAPAGPTLPPPPGSGVVPPAGVHNPYARTTAAEYVFYLPGNEYIYLKTGAGIKKEALLRELDAVTISGIDLERRVHCQAWDPTEPPFIYGRVMAVGSAGWIPDPGATTMNTFIPSNAERGDASQAGPWLDQVKRLYPKNWEHLVSYFALLAQKPGVKPNHGIVMGGNPGIGKDSILEGVKYTLGQHNCQGISPSALFNDFTPWTKCLMLLINEVHDTGDGVTRAQFYERMKTLTAAPPDQLTYNNKNVKAYPVRNCCGVILTTNHETGAMYLPPDDRRYLVLWSDQVAANFSPTDWVHWWAWYYGGGDKHIAALLHSWDISNFNPKAPPERTQAWHAMVGASVSDGDMELADALDALGRPKAITLDQLIRHCEVSSKASGLLEDLRDRRMQTRWPARLAGAGYTPVRNPAASGDGLYRIAGKRMKVYVQRELSEGARLDAAEHLSRFRDIPAPPGS